MNKKGTDKQYVAIFVTQYNSSVSSFVPNFRILSQVKAEKSLTEKKFIWRKKNEQINRLISNMWLFCLGYTIQLITIKLRTKFQNPKSSSCLEIFDRKKIHWRERKNGQIKGLISNMWLFFYISSLTGFLPNFRILSHVVAEKSLTEKN